MQILDVSSQAGFSEERFDSQRFTVTPFSGTQQAWLFSTSQPVDALVVIRRWVIRFSWWSRGGDGE